MVRNRIGAAAVAMTALATVPAAANVLIDHSPAALGGAVVGNWANGAGGQNFLVEFTLAQPAWIYGMDIFTSGLIALGAPTTIKIRENGTNGLPSSTNLFVFSSDVSDEQVIAVGSTSVTRNHSSFAPTLLPSGTWWIGDSFTTASGSWVSVAGGPQQPINQVQLAVNNLDTCCIGPTFPTTFTSFPSIYALAYQIEGASTVPEPPIPATLMVVSAGWIAWRIRAQSRSAYTKTPSR